MVALGESLERTLASAVASPESLRLAEALVAQAFTDVPEELRQPLALFAASMLASLRRDMLQNPRPRQLR